MIRFLIDEDMPRSTAKLLRQAGFECLDVRETELRGGKDDAVYQRAQKEDWVIISGDLGFANSLRYLWGVIRVLLLLGSQMRCPRTN